VIRAKAKTGGSEEMSRLPATPTRPNVSFTTSVRVTTLPAGTVNVTLGAGDAGGLAEARCATRKLIETEESAAAPLKSCRSVRELGPSGPPPRSTPRIHWNCAVLLGPKNGRSTGSPETESMAVPKGRTRPVVTEKTTRADGEGGMPKASKIVEACTW